MRLFGQPIDLFADQFEAEGAGFLYRKSMRGAPVRVTAAERDKFVQDFSRRSRILSWSMTAAVMALVLGAVGYAEAVGREAQDPLIYGGVGLLMTAFLLVWYRMWNAPARALQLRTPVGPAKSRSEVRRDMIASMSWVQMFVIMLLLGLLIVGSLSNGRAPSNIQDWVTLVLSGGAIAAWLWLAVMKLRLRR